MSSDLAQAILVLIRDTTSAIEHSSNAPELKELKVLALKFLVKEIERLCEAAIEQEDKEEYTTAEAAAEIGVEPQTLVRLIQKGKLVAEKRGRDYVIQATNWEKFKNTPRRPGRPAKSQQKQ